MMKELTEKLMEYRKIVLSISEIVDTDIFKSVMGPYTELVTCDILDLKISKSCNQAGYDAVDKDGNTYQIKVRHNADGKFEHLKINPDGSMMFDFLIAVIMDKGNEVTEAYKIPANFIKEKITNKDKDGNLTMTMTKKRREEFKENGSGVENIVDLYKKWEKEARL